MCLSGCVSVRPSGTEDVVRVYVEADTQVIVVVCLFVIIIIIIIYTFV